jgi:hypothetical protein
MKQWITVLALAVAPALSMAQAADAKKDAAPTAQQNKMSSCSAEFKKTGKPGSERQAWMSECLKKESDAKTAQQNKMTTCSADFKKTGKPGSERQAFMKECLSK